MVGELFEQMVTEILKYLPIYISVIATSAWLLVRQEVGQSFHFSGQGLGDISP